MPRIPQSSGSRLGQPAAIAPSTAAATSQAVVTALDPIRQGAEREAAAQAEQRVRLRGQEIARERRTAANQAEIAMTEAIRQTREEFAQDVGPNLSERHDAILGERINGIIDSIDDDDLRDTVNLRGVQRANSEGLAVALRADKQARALEIDTFEQNLVGLSNSFAGAPFGPEGAPAREDTVQRGIEAIEVQEMGKTISPLQAAKARRDFRRNNGIQLATRWITQDPAAALKALEDPADVDFAGIPVGSTERTTLIARAQGKVLSAQNKLKTRERQQLANRVRVATVDDEEALRRDIAGTADRGAIEDDQAVALNITLDSQLAAQKTAIRSDIAVSQWRAGARELDLGDKNNRAAYDRRYTASAVQPMLHEAWQDAAGGNEEAIERKDQIEADVAREVVVAGKIFPTLVGEMKSAVQRRDNRSAIQTSGLFTRIQAQPGGRSLLGREFTDEEMLWMDEVAWQQRVAGATQQEAIDHANTMGDMTPELRKLREDQFRDKGLGEKAAFEAADQMGTFMWFNANLPDEAKAEAAEVARRCFVVGGQDSIDRCASVAANAIQRRWATTSIGTSGETVWRIGPPELFDEISGADPTWMHEELQRDAINATGDFGIDPNSVHLGSADGLTFLEPGIKSFPFTVENERKNQVIPRDEQGVPQRIRFVYDQSLAKQRADTEATARAAASLEQAQKIFGSSFEAQEADLAFFIAAQELEGAAASEEVISSLSSPQPAPEPETLSLQEIQERLLNAESTPTVEQTKELLSIAARTTQGPDQKEILEQYKKINEADPKEAESLIEQALEVLKKAMGVGRTPRKKRAERVPFTDASDVTAGSNG